jgi:hypothetical protein
MKRLLVTLLLALPIAADDGKAPPAKPAETSTIADSPLVAAAKRNGRAKMPKKVITNATVKASKGHITTAATQRPLDLKPLPPPAVDPTVRKKKEEEAAKETAAKKAAAARERRRAAAASAAEEGLYEHIDDDPALAEAAEGTESKPPR